MGMGHFVRVKVDVDGAWPADFDMSYQGNNNLDAPRMGSAQNMMGQLAKAMRPIKG